MRESTVSRTYASAMIDVADQAGAIEAIGDDLNTFAKLLESGEGLLQHTLCSPVFSLEERRAVLEQIVPRLGMHALTANLIHLANDKGRLPIMVEIASAYATLADERAGRQRVTVTTAEPMSPQIEAEVRTALERTTGKTVLLQTEVDPSLIGGMVAKVGGTVYDSSIRTRLAGLRQGLLSRAIAEA